MADVSIGRFLMEAVSAVPKIDPDHFERAFNSHLQVSPCMHLYNLKYLGFVDGALSI